MRADRATELVGFEDVVGGDRDDLRVGDGDLGIQGSQRTVLLMIFRSVVSARKDKDHRVIALQFRQFSPLPCVIGQFVIRERGAGNDVCAHGGSPL